MTLTWNYEFLNCGALSSVSAAHSKRDVIGILQHNVTLGA